jgi:hypothetical protein
LLLALLSPIVTGHIARLWDSAWLVPLLYIKKCDLKSPTKALPKLVRKTFKAGLAGTLRMVNSGNFV